MHLSLEQENVLSKALLSELRTNTTSFFGLETRQTLKIMYPGLGYKSMSRITNTILSPSIPNPRYKKYLNERLTLIIPSHPSRCESWNDYPGLSTVGKHG